MNSFNTDEDTEKIVRKYKGFQVNIYSFNQSAFPRISRDSLLPVARKYEIEDNMEAWYPPVKYSSPFYDFQFSFEIILIAFIVI